MLDVGHHIADNRCASGCLRGGGGGAARHITKLLNGGTDFGFQRFGDTLRVIQIVRHSADGDACMFGDIRHADLTVRWHDDSFAR